jgi:hypothetical protein
MQMKHARDLSGNPDHRLPPNARSAIAALCLSAIAAACGLSATAASAQTSCPADTAITFSPDWTDGSNTIKNMMISIKVTEGEFTKLGETRSGAAAARPLTKDRIYKCFGDDFDFIYFILDSNRGEGAQTFHSAYRNRAYWGSASRLQGVVILPSRAHMVFGATLHELSHRWANNFLETESWSPRSCTEVQPARFIQHYKINGEEKTVERKDVTCSQTIRTGLIEPPASRGPNDDPAHWGVSSVGGQLGGFVPGTVTQVTKSGKTYWESSKFFAHNAAGGNRVPYAPLELYLMGLAPASVVPPVTVFTGLQDVWLEAVDTSANGRVGWQLRPRFVATKTVYTPRQLRDKAGPLPSAYDSDVKEPRMFRALGVVVTTTDIPTADDKSIYGWKDFQDAWYWFGMKSDDLSPFKIDGKAQLKRSYPEREALQDVTAIYNLYKATKQTLETYADDATTTGADSTTITPTGTTVSVPGAYFAMTDLTRDIKPAATDPATAK